MRYILFFFFPLITLLSMPNKYFTNHLVEKNGKFLKLFSNEIVFGDIFRYFSTSGEARKEVFIGHISSGGKHGEWKRWWDNGNIKSHGYYYESKKLGLWTEWMKNGKKYSQIYYNYGSILFLKNCILEQCD
tara:strand:+ start:21239 stop:21631 length:393 start_codon:yes stop_codon:yes gene_type:complete